MTSIFKRLAQVDTRRLLYIVPVVYLLHEIEEWNILAWHKSVNTGVPDVTDLHVRIALVFVLILGVVWTGISLIAKSRKVMIYTAMPLIAISIANGIQHLIWWIHFNVYAPGVIFGFFLGAPVFLFIAVRMVKEHLVARLYSIACGCSVLVQTVLSLLAGDAIDPAIAEAMILGSSVSKFFGW